MAGRGHRAIRILISDNLDGDSGARTRGFRDASGTGERGDGGVHFGSNLSFGLLASGRSDVRQPISAHSGPQFYFAAKNTGLPTNPVETVQGPSAPAGTATHVLPLATPSLYRSPMSLSGLGMTPQRSS
jgi:hypothetical protein